VGVERLRRCRPGLADRTGRPGRGRRACASAPRLDVQGDTGANSLGRRSGRAAPRSPTGAGRGPPVATDGGVLLARAVDPSPRRVGAAWRQPSCSPRHPPAVNAMVTPLPRTAALARPPDPPQPVELRRQRPGAVLQVLQVAMAVERPTVDAARPAAPVAGLRGARTGVVGPGPAGASAALVDPRSGLDADLPGPARLPAAHQPSPPLAWLPGSDQPTKQAGTAKPEPHGARSPYSPAMGSAGQGLGPDHATHAGVTSAGSSALAGVVAKPVDRHCQPPAARSTAAWHTHVGSCRSKREGPGGPGEGSGEPCRSGGS
jgi:hypothetical protein